MREGGTLENTHFLAAFSSRIEYRKKKSKAEFYNSIVVSNVKYFITETKCVMSCLPTPEGGASSADMSGKTACSANIRALTKTTLY
jgi:hypothetical protein